MNIKKEVKKILEEDKEVRCHACGEKLVGWRKTLGECKDCYKQYHRDMGSMR